MRRRPISLSPGRDARHEPVLRRRDGPWLRKQMGARAARHACAHQGDARRALLEGPAQRGVKQDLGFINREQGMSSYSGFNAAQMQRLRA